MRRDLQGNVEAGFLVDLVGQAVGLPHQPVCADDVLPQLVQASLEHLVSEINSLLITFYGF